MNKHRGSNFDDYLKEKGISKKVSALAQKRWGELRPETSNEIENTADIRDNPPGHIKKLLHRLRHNISHLFT